MANRITNAWNALTGKKPEVRSAVPDIKKGFLGYMLGTDAGEDFVNLNYDVIARQAFERNPVGYKCVTEVARGVGGLGWCLRKASTKERITKSPLLDLIHRPNVMQGQATFFANAIGDQLLDGNCFIEINSGLSPPSRANPPRELSVLRPDFVQIQLGTSRIPTSYVYNASSLGSGGSRTYPVNQVDGTSQVLHIMPYSPRPENRQGRGISPIVSAWLAIQTHTEGSRWNRNLLRNDARPSGVFTSRTASEGSPSSLGQENIDQIKAQYDEFYGGGKNAGKSMVLDGLTYTQMSLDPKDMDFENSKNSAARDIAMALGVPPILLHIPGDSTYNNVIQAREALYENTIIPVAKHLCDEFNRWLTPYFGDDLELFIDEDNCSALATKHATKLASLSSSTVLSTNEKRVAIGYEEVPEGDEILVPSNVVPLTVTITDPDDPADDTGGEPRE